MVELDIVREALKRGAPNRRFKLSVEKSVDWSLLSPHYSNIILIKLYRKFSSILKEWLNSDLFDSIIEGWAIVKFENGDAIVIDHLTYYNNSQPIRIPLADPDSFHKIGQAILLSTSD